MLPELGSSNSEIQDRFSHFAREFTYNTNFRMSKKNKKLIGNKISFGTKSPINKEIKRQPMDFNLIPSLAIFIHPLFN
uniref:Uncharacterized protein n=1 Tax=Gossypium raimondii TaxID=29730 RepID=A0A0D2MM63_GOSRA|nr:hypothetical protein B456_003G105800 [Gossypium raimondii]